jgi:hypothetical protein
MHRSDKNVESKSTMEPQNILIPPKVTSNYIRCGRRTCETHRAGSQLSSFFSQFLSRAMNDKHNEYLSLNLID